MADIEAAPPPPAWRSAAATAAWALSWFLSLASHVAVCLFLSASWTCSLTNGVRIAARWVFGVDSPEAAFVKELFYMTIYAVLLLVAVAFVLAMALFLHCFVMAQLLRRRWRREGREIAGNSVSMIIHAAREHDREGAGDEDDGSDGVFGLVTVVGLLTFFAPAQVLVDACFFLASLTYCYVMFLTFAAKVIHEWDEEREICALLTSSYIDG